MLRRMPKIRQQTTRASLKTKDNTTCVALRNLGTRHGGTSKKILKGGRTHLLVVVDKFTKWIEPVPITNSTALTAVNFIKFIIFRFRFPHNIITDDGTNFKADE